MDYESRDAVDKNGNVVGVVTMPVGTPEDVWAYLLSRYNPPATPIYDVIINRLTKYEKSADQLLKDIKTSNTLAGITLAQSAQMFIDFQHVLMAIREGAFPTAIYLLQNATPSGFVTQPMIDDMIARITAKL